MANKGNISHYIKMEIMNKNQNNKSCDVQEEYLLNLLLLRRTDQQTHRQTDRR